MFIGGLVVLPLALAVSPLSSWNVFSLGWTYLIAFVLLFNVVGLTMWFASLKTVRGWMVSALRAIGPIAGAPFAWLLFGEILSPVQIIGALIVVSTSAIIAREHIKRR
jgi:probable blue pigment (indigoidine) exporter